MKSLSVVSDKKDMANNSKSKINKNKKRKGGMQSLNSILLKYDIEDDKPKYVTKEFQDYGYRLALEMGDVKRAGMYIKFAKTINRAILEKARSFVKDANNVKSKPRLFMWKIKDLRKGKKTAEKKK